MFKLIASLLLLPSLALATEITTGVTKGLSSPGGTSTIIINEVTSCVGFADQSVIFADGAVINCADPIFKYDKDTGTVFADIFDAGSTGPGALQLTPGTLTALGTPADGTFTYCSNCIANTTPCSTVGTGSFAERVDGVWVCGAASAFSTPTPVPTSTPQPTPTLVPTATPIPAVATPTPLAFGTPNVVPKFAASELGASGITDDGTNVTIARGLSYSGKLNITGLLAMSTSISSGATDRIVLCTSGSSTDKTYTLPTATGTGRTIDVIKVDTGTKACIVAAPSGVLNAGTMATLPTVWGAETCIDIGSGIWACRGTGTVS